MKNFLFPRAFRVVGWILFVPSSIMGLLRIFNCPIFPDLAETIINDVIIIGIALGALFMVCSKERHEDEVTRAIRLASLLNSLYAYVAILVVSTIFMNGTGFVYFMMANLVLLPIIYVFLFSLEMYSYNKLSGDEE